MRSKRHILHLLLAVLLVSMLVLAGCGSSGSNESEDSGTNQSETAGSDSGSTDTENNEGETQTKDKASISGEVKVLTPWGAGYTEQFNKMFADFNKEYPNIKVTYLEQTTAELGALIAAGEAPDIISVNGTSPDLREDNQIEDLMPYFSTDPDVSPDLYYEPAYTRSLTPDGKLWGLQWHVDPNFALMINPEVLDQQGYTELPDLNSLQQLGDFLKQFWIVRNGQQEMTTFLPNEVYGNNNSLMTMAYLNGADQNSYYNPETMTVTFNDPKIVEALEWMVQFKRENIDYTRLAEMDATLPEGTGRFQAGKSLMEPHVTVNLINNYKMNPDLMFAPMPSESLWIGGWSWGLTTAGSKENKEAAWELLKWMTSTKEGARSELEHFGWISGIKDHPALMEQLETSPPLQAAYEVLQNARKVPPQIPVPFEDELNAKWPEVMDGKLEPKAFLDHMTQYVQKLIDEKYKQ